MTCATLVPYRKGLPVNLRYKRMYRLKHCCWCYYLLGNQSNFELRFVSYLME